MRRKIGSGVKLRLLTSTAIFIVCVDCILQPQNGYVEPDALKASLQSLLT
jgi:hypothetical protein